jgi:hypothetical protein
MIGKTFSTEQLASIAGLMVKVRMLFIASQDSALQPDI